MSKNKIGIKLYDGRFVPLLTVDEPKSKRVVLTTVKDNQKKAIIELYEGTNDNCLYNEFLGKLTIDIDRETKKGEPAIEVNLRLDNNGILYVKAWDPESNAQASIMIEHPKDKTKIQHETLEVEAEPAVEKSEIQDYQFEEGKGELFKKIGIILLIIGIALLVGLSIFFISTKIVSTVKRLKEKRVELKEERKKPEVKEPEVKIQEEKKEIIGEKKVEGKIHYVKWGDNLWNICKKYYGDPWYYPALAEVNNIKKPRLIYAGTTLIIPPKSQLKRWEFLK